MVCVTQQPEVGAAVNQEGRQAASHAETQSLMDVCLLGLFLILPVTAMETLLVMTNDHYIPRNAFVEIGSRIRGNLYTLHLNCSAARADKAVFRAWSEREARTFLASQKPDCAVQTISTGAEAYRTGLWARH